MWKSLSVKETEFTQVLQLKSKNFATLATPIYGWSNGRNVLSHEHEDGKSCLRLYGANQKLEMEWPYQGWPNVSFKKQQYKVVFESYYRAFNRSKSAIKHLHYLHHSNIKPKFIVISMHGGPESLELDEIRYGGWYADVIRAGGCVCIWNYAGSVGFGRRHRIKPHRQWLHVIEKDFANILKVVDKDFNLGSEKVILFGPSFGGTLALYLHQRSALMGRVLLNPVIDINGQAERSKISGEFSWFRKRFNLKTSEFNPYLLPSSGKEPRHFLVSTHDEVVDGTVTRKLFREWSSTSTDHFQSLKCFRHTPRSKTTEKILRHHLNRALKNILRSQRATLSRNTKSLRNGKQSQ